MASVEVSAPGNSAQSSDQEHGRSRREEWRRFAAFAGASAVLWIGVTGTPVAVFGTGPRLLLTVASWACVMRYGSLSWTQLVTGHIPFPFRLIRFLAQIVVVLGTFAAVLAALFWGSCLARFEGIHSVESKTLCRATATFGEYDAVHTTVSGLMGETASRITVFWRVPLCDGVGVERALLAIHGAPDSPPDAAFTEVDSRLLFRWQDDHGQSRELFIR